MYGKKLICIDAIRKAAEFVKHSEVLYRAENIHVDFDNFDHIIDEMNGKLTKNCEYDDSKKLMMAVAEQIIIV